jgi:hypothetical protein
MRTLLTRRAGQPGTKKLMREYGRNLICVRYRYDADQGQRIKTVELVLERVSWRRRERDDSSAAVHFRIAEKEDLLRRAVLLAGGRWDEMSDTWMLPRKAAVALGLTPRLRKR